jgi:hypothetical protein
MYIARGGFDVGVVGRLLHELEIASVAEEFVPHHANVVGKFSRPALEERRREIRAARSEGSGDLRALPGSCAIW